MKQNLEKLSSLFDVKYGVNLDLNKLERTDKANPKSVNFVSRTEKNNGISAFVRLIDGLKPNEQNTISVAAGGSVLSSFLQPEPYYSGRDVFVLKAKNPMSELELLYYCHCIKENKYRYNYGRQANKTIRNILVPKEAPQWIKNLELVNKPNISPIISKEVKIDISNWEWFEFSNLFEISRGRGIRLNEELEGGKYPIVTSTDQNNGYSGKTDNKPTHKANTISITRNGSVGEAFYQPKDFCSTEDVHILSPKFPLNSYIGLFLTAIIRKEKYRYNYGRKWGLQRMKDTLIKLPSKNGKPDFDFMENFIKSLPYSSSI